MSGVVVPVAINKASDLLPADEASFEDLRAANAELRASDADLAQANSKQVAVLKAAEAKLQELFSVSSKMLSCFLPGRVVVSDHPTSGAQHSE